MIYLVSGSRKLHAHEHGFVAEKLASHITWEGLPVLIVGDAQGVDSFAYVWWAQRADALGVELPKRFEAAWISLGLKAGRTRNLDMVAHAQSLAASAQDHGIATTPILIAFPRPGGKGTKHMIQTCADADFEVHSYPLVTRQQTIFGM